MPFQLNDLPYPYHALEPHIDAKTMEIHFTKHHDSYCRKLNAAIKGTPLESILAIEDILAKGPDELPLAIRNHGGGFANHNLFWSVMSPKGGGKPSGDLAAAIDRDFSTLDQFKEKFTVAAESEFGSGWVWLVSSGGKLQVFTTPNQDSPLMFGKTPVLGVDLWEHAYYLQYQNRRADYLSAWWNVVDWNKVAGHFVKTVRS